MNWRHRSISQRARAFQPRRPGWVGPVLLTTALLVAAFAGLARWLGPPPTTFTGWGEAIDGDSLRIGGAEIRLKGIDAPELRQTCRRAGNDFSCGRDAFRQLATLLRAGPITCSTEGRDRYGRSLAVCSREAIVLNAAMVRAGQAIAYGGYAAEESEAKTARRGLWNSEFIPPATWRAQHPRD